MRIAAANRLDVHERETLSRSPISERRPFASLRLIKANGPLGQIVFNVEMPEEILTDQSGFLAANLAPRDHEFDVVERRAEEGKILDAGEPCLLLAADTRDRIVRPGQLQIEFPGGSG